MLDWSLERRAMWMYHNRHTIDSHLYAQQMQNAQLQARVAALEGQGVQRNPNYVDSEYKDNPDLMYSNEYVSAAYNPAPAPAGGGSYLWWILGAFVVAGLIWLVFIKRWGN